MSTRDAGCVTEPSDIPSILQNAEMVAPTTHGDVLASQISPLAQAPSCSHLARQMGTAN